MKATFDIFGFIQGMSLDVMDEINQLDKAIEKNEKNEVRRQYNHCESLLTGIRYSLDYIEEDDIRQNLRKTVDEMRDILRERHDECKKVIRDSRKKEIEETM